MKREFVKLYSSLITGSVCFQYDQNEDQIVYHHGLQRWMERIGNHSFDQIVNYIDHHGVLCGRTKKHIDIWIGEPISARLLLCRLTKGTGRSRRSAGNRWIIQTVVKGKRKEFRI